MSFFQNWVVFLPLFWENKSVLGKSVFEADAMGNFGRNIHVTGENKRFEVFPPFVLLFSLASSGKNRKTKVGEKPPNAYFPSNKVYLLHGKIGVWTFFSHFCFAIFSRACEGKKQNKSGRKTSKRLFSHATCIFVTDCPYKEPKIIISL